MRKPGLPVMVLSDLDPWDRELARAVAAGLTHAEIGKRLGLAPQTVTNRISQIGKRLKVVRGSSPTRRIMRWMLAQKATTLAE